MPGFLILWRFSAYTAQPSLNSLGTFRPTVLTLLYLSLNVRLKENCPSSRPSILPILSLQIAVQLWQKSQSVITVKLKLLRSSLTMDKGQDFGEQGHNKVQDFFKGYNLTEFLESYQLRLGMSEGDMHVYCVQQVEIMPFADLKAQFSDFACDTCHREVTLHLGVHFFQVETKLDPSVLRKAFQK